MKTWLLKLHLCETRMTLVFQSSMSWWNNVGGSIEPESKSIFQQHTIAELADPIICLTPNPISQANEISDFRYGLSQFGLFWPIPGEKCQQTDMLNIDYTQNRSKMWNNMENRSNMMSIRKESSFPRILPKKQYLANFSQSNIGTSTIQDNADEEIKLEIWKNIITSNDNSLSRLNINSECSASANVHRLNVDVSDLKNMIFKDVKEIRKQVNAKFAPKNVKMICKRAERIYTNSYCVFVLYCHRCSKRGPTYMSKTRYKKRSTDWPFQLRFTKHKGSDYKLTDGVFYHNHEQDTPVILPVILDFIHQFDPFETKPAEVLKLVNIRFGKNITYAQVAYELSKMKKVRILSNAQYLYA